MLMDDCSATDMMIILVGSAETPTRNCGLPTEASPGVTTPASLFIYFFKDDESVSLDQEFSAFAQAPKHNLVLLPRHGTDHATHATHAPR
jgi:hypothetical protein